MDSEKLNPGLPPEASTAIVALTRNGVGLALRLQAKMPGSHCYVPDRYGFAIAMGAFGFERARELFPKIWPKYRALICIMATGIVVRLIGPLLRHKTKDPAVVVLDERGLFAISLVSGHLGGANRLAHEVARLTGGTAVITTASDVSQKPALDLIARDAGLEVENKEMLGRLARALIEDEAIRVFDPEARLKPYLTRQPNIEWLHEGTEDPAGPRRPWSGAAIWASDRLGCPWDCECLLLRPRSLVVGMGCNRGTPAGEVLDLLKSVFEQEALSLLSIRNLASIDLKADEPGLIQAAKILERPIHFYSREELEPVIVPNPSDVVAEHIGVKSVCEAAALLSSQSRSLIVAKRKTANVTLAVARVAYPS